MNEHWLKYRGSLKTKQVERRGRFLQQLGGKCVNCSATDRLHFDHIVPGTKTFHLSSGGLNHKEEKLADELLKCQILCFSCHLEKSILERGDQLRKGTHGHISVYNNYRCRCEACKEANRAYQAQYKQKQKGT